MTSDNTYQQIIEVWDSFDVILTDSYAQATALNTAKACQSKAGAFGLIATTFNSWFDGLWEQYGSGEQFVSQPYSVLLIRLLINQGKLGPALTDSPNLPVAVSKCASRASGIAAFEEVLADPSKAPEQLTRAEHDLLELIAAYRGVLEQRGLIERGCATARLAQQGIDWLQTPMRVCYVSDAPLPTLQEEFFCTLGVSVNSGEARKSGAQEDATQEDATQEDATQEDAASSSAYAPSPCAAVELIHLTRTGEAYEARPPQVATAPKDVTQSFMFPAGQYAKAQALGKVLQHAAADGPIVITAQDPCATYHALTHVLDDAGLRGAVRAHTSMLQTPLGRVYNALHQTQKYECGQDVLFELADVLRTPFFGLSAGQLDKLRCAIRDNRLISVEESLALMAQESQTFACFKNLLEHPSEAALAQLHDAADAAPGYAPADLRSLHTALDTIGGFLLAAIDLGVPEQKAEALVFPLLAAVRIPASQANFDARAGQAPDVLVMNQWQAALLDTKQCATLVIDDLDNASYPAGLRDNAVSVFLEHVGVEEPEDYTMRQRRAFASLVSLPSKHLIFGRCLHDIDMKETYPAAMLEEYLGVNDIEIPSARGRDAYGDAGGGFPLVFPAIEEELEADALGSAPSWQTEDTLPKPLPPEGSERSFLSQIYKPRPGATSADSGEATRLRESPSQLEVYHECPRKWFVSRWLNVTEPGEGFGPLERGSYIHECVQRFYQQETL